MRCKLLLVEGIHQSYTQDMEIISSKDFVALICFTLATLLISFIMTTYFAALLPNLGAVTKILYGFPNFHHKSKTLVTAVKIKIHSDRIRSIRLNDIIRRDCTFGKGKSEDTLSNYAAFLLNH